MMLTLETSTLTTAGATRVYALEFDLEHGHVQHFGQADVYYYPPGRSNGPTLESGATGGCYNEPQVIAGVEVWNAEEHYLAIFPDEPAMRAGGRQLAAAWGDDLPAGIHRVIA